jgi:hypothetical protein
MSASVYCSLNAVQPAPPRETSPCAPALLSILRHVAVEPGALRQRADTTVETRETETESS